MLARTVQSRPMRSTGRDGGKPRSGYRLVLPAISDACSFLFAVFFSRLPIGTLAELFSRGRR